MGNIDLNVVKNATSWAEGIKNYHEQKLKHVYDGETPKPHYVTRHFKSREEAAVNPITQKFCDNDIERTLVQMEQSGLSRTLNRAYDKQLLREQHFDVITQQPKKGHIHEVPYVQRLKPPSLITANNVGYNILSCKGLDEHHWAAPDKRPPRVVTPPRKEPFLTEVNKPREYDILNNKYREFHDERQKWEANKQREAIVDKYWELRDFNPLTCAYYDAEKEQYYKKRVQEMLLSQGSNAIGKLPPTLAASESLMYDICTGVVKDPVRLKQKIEADRLALENRASKIGAEERMRVHGDVTENRKFARKIARVSHGRYLDVTDRGYNIISGNDFDKYGHPPPAKTKPRPSLWEFQQTLKEDSDIQMAPINKTMQVQMKERSGSAASGAYGGHGSQSDRGGESDSRRTTTLSGARIRSGGFASR
jgi:hypothetical protein